MATGTIPKYADGTDTGFQEITSDAFSGTIRYRVIGKMVEVTCYGLTLTSALTTSNVSLVSGENSPLANYPPIESKAFAAGNRDALGEAIIYTSGGIRFYKPTSVSEWSTSATIQFSAFYFTSA